MTTVTLRDVITAVGPDTVKFLHSQLSQDITAMSVGDIRWSFLLQPTGKLVGLLRVVRTGEEVITIDTDSGNGQGVFDALSRFKIRTKCDLSLLPHVTFSADWSSRLPVLGVAADSEQDNSEDARIRAGFPRWGYELNEATIPNATGLISYAVSFTKGCYTGQELVERIDARGGNVPERLVHVAFADPGPVLGDLQLDGAICGRLTSVTAAHTDGISMALGFVKRHVEAGAVVQNTNGASGEIREIL